MNCAEFHDVLPEGVDRGRSSEQEAHLKTCSACSGLVADLDFISREARMLRDSEEPSPRVWNSIELALRQEGLIRQPQREPSLARAWPRRWTLAWLIPVAAAFLLAIGLVIFQRAPEQASNTAQMSSAVTQGPAPTPASSDDRQLMEVVDSHAPAMRASYQADLQDVDSYIRDAKQSTALEPNDEEAQQVLMNAYQQRAMVYEMAMDRSLQ